MGSQALLASARSAYRSALRASASTFSGDQVVRNGECARTVHACPPTHHVVPAFRLKIRNEVLPYSSSIDPEQFEEKVTLVREIADVLRKNVVQARKVEHSPSQDQKEVWGVYLHPSGFLCEIYPTVCYTELNINEHTELGSNETIKQAKTDMTKSGRKPVK